MTAMTCRLSGLFSVGDDFDDEDLLETDWAVRPAPPPAPRASSGGGSTDKEPGRSCPQQDAEGSAALCAGTARSGAHGSAAHAVALGLRQLCSSVRTPSPCPPRASSPRPDLAPQQGRSHTAGAPGPCGAQDDFDDWDVDLADLDECDQPLHPPAPAPPADSPASSARTLRPPSCGGLQSQSHQSRRELSTAATIGYKEPPWTPSAPFQSPNTRPAFPSALPHSRNTFTAPSPISRPLNRPQRPWAPPARSPQAPPQTVSPGPSSSSSTSLSASALSPHPLHTPVLTNRLVQLVSASSKRPAKRPRSECHRPRTRRFPGPAGLLPEQPQAQSLDQIVVSVPVLPAHGAVARTPSQGSSSQTDDEEFLGGAWAAMKAEMGLDETNPSCFLHSYSVVMVLRKAALKQLAKNKVPNMAVLLKSIVHTHVDAKAVFKDPTGEIQGTVHRHLLKDRVDELKVGAVLLLKQVGVFSPSHRNHYLNVTANNLLRIYAPDGVGLSSTPLPPLVLEPMSPSPARPAGVLREPVSQMHLVFDDEDDEGQASRDTDGGSSREPREPAGTPAPQDPNWDSDDNLDALLGELPEDTYSL